MQVRDGSTTVRHLGTRRSGGQDQHLHEHEDGEIHEHPGGLGSHQHGAPGRVAVGTSSIARDMGRRFEYGRR